MTVQPFSATAPVKALAGSNTEPGITFTGDTDTGLYSPGANQVAIATGGVQRLLISSDGSITPASPLRFPLGSAGAPSISFTGDTNTGIYSPGADQLALSTNGTGRLFVDASGNVGVATASPGASFHVRGATKIGEGAASNTSELMVNTLSGTAAGIQLFQDATESWIIQNPGSSTALTFSNSGTERLRITSAGLVGVGTSSPGTKLEIRNDVAATTSLDTAAIKLYNNLDGGSGIEFANGVAGKSKISFGVESAGAGTDDTYLGFSTCANAGALTERLRIDSSGRVGIGTTSPGYLIDASNSSAPTLRLTDGVRHLLVRGGSTTQNPGIGTDYAGDLSFFTNGTANERARIDSSGRLLVGTSSDSGGALLQVNGDRIRVATAKTPASASDTGTAGEICWDASYIYVCTATNTWKRAALSTW